MIEVYLEIIDVETSEIINSETFNSEESYVDKWIGSVNSGNLLADIALTAILNNQSQERKEVSSEEMLNNVTNEINNNLPIQLEAKVNEYLSLIMKLIFAFGLSFQLPVVLSLLARIGVVDSQFLKQRRKYVVVIIFAAAAILTPPDPVTQIGLAIPLLLLYELSIISVKIIEKKNKEKNA